MTNFLFKRNILKKMNKNSENVVPLLFLFKFIIAKIKT